ncbi:MAG: helix-turn-helix domain-containing protein [Mycobacterium sp.]
MVAEMSVSLRHDLAGGVAVGRAVADRGNHPRMGVIAKGLEVLSLFDHSATTLKLHEICERTGLPKATAFRIVETLEERGFLEKLRNGAPRPDLAVLTLGSAGLGGSALVRLSVAHLRDLVENTGQTVSLGIDHVSAERLMPSAESCGAPMAAARASATWMRASAESNWISNLSRWLLFGGVSHDQSVCPVSIRVASGRLGHR